MTEQEAFDIAYRGLASQGFEQSDSEGTCLYRDPRGRRCAAGWLISDDDYRSHFENHTADHLPVEIFHGLDLIFVCDLQIAHDHAGNPEDMKERLADFAREYNLTIPEIVS